MMLSENKYKFQAACDQMPVVVRSSTRAKAKAKEIGRKYAKEFNSNERKIVSANIEWNSMSECERPPNSSSNIFSFRYAPLCVSFCELSTNRKLNILIVFTWTVWSYEWILKEAKLEKPSESALTSLCTFPFQFQFFAFSARILFLHCLFLLHKIWKSQEWKCFFFTSLKWTNISESDAFYEWLNVCTNE